LLAFGFLVASVWFFLSLLMHGLAGQARESIWQRVAKRFGGRADRGGWFRRPRIQFRYGESPVVVERGRHHRLRHCLDVWFTWPDPQLTLHVASTARPLPAAATRGLRLLENKHEFFYRYFRVYTNDAARSEKLLRDTLRWEIEQLRQPTDVRDIEVRWHRGAMLVRKRVSHRDPEAVEKLIRRALRIYDQAMLLRAEGIEFLASEEAQIIDRVCCQVCGEEIVTDMVFCRRCQTPHHRDCWQYLGRCAIFACPETEFFVPRIARREEK
jgi:hypothetical protein